MADIDSETVAVPTTGSVDVPRVIVAALPVTPEVVTDTFCPLVTEVVPVPTVVEVTVTFCVADAVIVAPFTSVTFRAVIELSPCKFAEDVTAVMGLAEDVKLSVWIPEIVAGVDVGVHPVLVVAASEMVNTLVVPVPPPVMLSPAVKVGDVPFAVPEKLFKLVINELAPTKLSVPVVKEKDLPAANAAAAAAAAAAVA